MGLESGDRVDRYVLRARLGEGGQGEVWRADDPLEPDRPKALKLVRVASASGSQLERLRREARRLVQLKHPSLVACHALFEDLHHDIVGIVMEFADGLPLDDIVHDPDLSEQDRLLLLAHVASALGYVHQRNVVHRDIKLENVVVTRGFRAEPANPSTVKLIDFGIAVESDNPKPLTQIGHVIGTPPYLAPELIDPQMWGGKGAATPTSDVFAFGVLALKLLTRDPSAHPTGLPPRAQTSEYAIAYRRGPASRGPPANRPPRGAARTRLPCIASARTLGDGLAVLGELERALPGVKLPTAIYTEPTPLAGIRCWLRRHGTDRARRTLHPASDAGASARTVPQPPPNLSTPEPTPRAKPERKTVALGAAGDVLVRVVRRCIAGRRRSVLRGLAGRLPGCLDESRHRSCTCANSNSETGHTCTGTYGHDSSARTRADEEASRLPPPSAVPVVVLPGTTAAPRGVVRSRSRGDVGSSTVAAPET